MIRKFIDDLGKRGIDFRVTGESLVCDAPLDALTAAERDRIRELKPEIIAYLVPDAGIAQPVSRIRSVPRDRPIPLGLVQQRMWLLDHLEPGSTVNNLPGAWRLAGALDYDALVAALREITRRHEILRTRIVARVGEPVQVIEHDFSPDLPLVDLRALPVGERSEEMMRQIRTERDTPFDLSRLPLFRACLFRLADDEHVLFMVAHHVIWDGWSWDVFHDEISTLYSAFRAGKPSPLPDLTVQYADYAVWHRDLMNGPELERQLGYWRNQLGGDLPRLELPIDGPRPERVSQRGGRRILDINGQMVERLWQLGREEEATLFMVLLAAYAAWLLRYTGQKDLTIGVPTQDRLEEGADRLIGVLVNTLVIRVRADGKPAFRDLLRQIRDTCIDAYDNQDVPFDRLVDELGVHRSSTYTPLYQTLFTFQDVRNRPEHLDDLALSQVHVDTGVAPTDVLFGFMVGHDRTVALLDFAADLFQPESMSRMAASFAGLLRDIATAPDRQIGRLSVISASHEQRRETGDIDLFAALTDSDDVQGAPLTYGQEGMWFLERATPGTAVHHLVEAFRFHGQVRPDMLKRAFSAVAACHESLRYRFTEQHGEARLEVIPGDLDVIEFSDLSGAADPQSEAADAFDMHARRPFDLENGPLVRGLLLKLADDDFALQLVFHHMIVDECSIAILYRDLSAAYRACVSGGEPGLPQIHETFRSHAVRSRQALNLPEIQRQLDFWTDRLAHPAPPLDVADRLRPPVLSMTGGSVPLDLGADSAAIDRLSSETGASALAVVLAALHTVLRRYGSDRRLTVGVPVQVRPQGEAWDRVAGLFLNTVVVESEMNDDSIFTKQVALNQIAVAAATANADVPFSKVVEQVQPVRSLNRSPLFQLLLSVDARPAATLRIQGIEVEPVFCERPGLQTDLAIYLNRESGAWRGRIDYSTDLFERVTIERLARHLCAVLDAATRAGNVHIGDLEMLSPAERTRLLSEWNATEREVEDSTVLEAMAARARMNPDALALSQDGIGVSYGELWARSASIARALRSRGVGRGGVIGVCFERTPSMVVAMLAVWRAGAAYVPLDPDFPEDRLRFVAEDSQCSLVLTDGVAEDVLPREFPGIVLLSQLESEGHDVDSPLPAPASEDLAYIMYTSGSTGHPKGVELEHGSLVNFMTSMAELPGLDADDILLAVTTPSFDISILELFLPLWVGARVIVATDDEVRAGELLAARIAADGVTVMQATPATWRMLLDAGWSGGLRKLISGGEAFPPELLTSLRACAHEIWNVYGPTETTIWSTVSRVEDAADGPVAIGRPIANTSVYVVDGRGRLSPQGMPGELWIGGRGVARGYHDRPTLTAERFIADPFAPAGHARSRVYRTGDLVRWRSDGRLEHLGRLDDQVKINGHRIELGEIETTLAQHPDASHAVVAVKAGSDGERRLVAYVVWQSSAPPLASEVRRYLGRTLPDYMVPGLIVELDALPLTPNGKVDRNALPNPLEVVTIREHVEPQTRMQRAVASAWSTLLGQERIGLHDNFFELGGYSLLSIRAVALIEEQSGLRIDPRSMFFQTLEQVVAEGERNVQPDAVVA
jgi:amino acid adenylation domain-containing protein